MIKFSTYGGSHYQCIGGTVSGLPIGYEIDLRYINSQLELRKCGVGRSVRQTIETDNIVIDGLIDGKTSANDITFVVPNVDNRLKEKPPITAVRSGHADLIGAVKYGYNDARPVAEIASGRSTLAHTVIGAICKQILEQKGIYTYGFVRNIGGIKTNKKFTIEMLPSINHSIVRTIDNKVGQLMFQAITDARSSGDTLGGIVQVGCFGLPMGVGDYHDYYDKLDSRISAYMMAIPSVKGIEFGLGFGFANKYGSKAMDTLELREGDIRYKTNKMGGIVGGISNGEELNFRLVVKPIPSLARKIPTLDMVTKEQVMSHYERSDICIVPNIATIAENMLATVLLDSIMQDNRIAKDIGL